MAIELFIRRTIPKISLGFIAVSETDSCLAEVLHPQLYILR